MLIFIGLFMGVFIATVIAVVLSIVGVLIENYWEGGSDDEEVH